MGRSWTSAITDSVRPPGRRLAVWVALVVVVTAPVLAETLHTCSLTGRTAWMDSVSLVRPGGAAPPALCPGCLLGKMLLSALPLAPVVLACTVFVAPLGSARTDHPVYRGIHASPSRAPPAVSW